tara:strand:- start:489 stop:1187 length:699 start_codon:yes stop_codon:yes gene_type:complete
VKHVLVIGGSSGIGKQLVHDLHEKGYAITIASRSAKKAEGLPNGVQRQEYDVTGNSQLEVPEELHGLVYCPGTINLRPFERISMDNLQHELQINYLGAVKVIQQCVKALKKSGQGSVVLFSTVAVQTGMPFHSSISAAKGAVEGLTRSLAAEYAPAIRFNAVAPSLTDTPLAEGLLSNHKKREANASRHPLKRVGEARDTSKMACYLLSDDARWISGQVFKVDGGMSDLRTL